MGEFFLRLTDFISAKWAELLAIFGGTAGVIGVLTIIAKLLVPFVVSKINKKNNIPQRLEAIKVKLEQLDSFIESLPNLIQTEVNNGIATYQNAKKEAYKKIVEKKEEAEKQYAELEAEVDKINSEVEETKQIIENKAEIKPTTEETKQVEQITEEQTKAEKKAKDNGKIKVVISE